MIPDIILLAAAAGCLIWGVVSFSRGKQPAIWIGAAVLLGVIGGPKLSRDLQPPPLLPGAGLFTDAESAASAAYTGPVTPGTFFRFMGWTGPLDLSPVDRLTSTQDPDGVVTVHAAGEFLLLGLPGYGGSSPRTSHGTTVALPYPGYEFSVTNMAGQAVIVDLPSTSLEFSVVPAGHRPFALFVFRNRVFYTKGADRTPIFATGEDRAASGTGQFGGDAGQEFSRTPIDQLLTRWVAVADVDVTPAQFAALTNPKLAGIPAS